MLFGVSGTRGTAVHPFGAHKVWEGGEGRGATCCEMWGVSVLGTEPRYSAGRKACILLAYRNVSDMCVALDYLKTPKMFISTVPYSSDD